jgi:hypothetical protein
MVNQAVIDRATKTAILANMSVEQHDAQLREMEMAWCREKTSPFPDHICTTFATVRARLEARDAKRTKCANPTTTTTEPITTFELGTAAPASIPTLTPTSAPVQTPALPPPAETPTLNSNPIGSDTAVTAPSPAPAPTHYETTTTKLPDCEIEAQQVAITTAPGPVKSQDCKELERERRGNGEEREDKRQQTREENKGSTEREERRDDEGIEEKV